MLSWGRVPSSAIDDNCQPERYVGTICHDVLVNWQSCALGLVTTTTTTATGNQFELEEELSAILNVIGEQIYPEVSLT